MNINFGAIHNYFNYNNSIGNVEDSFRHLNQVKLNQQIDVYDDGTIRSPPYNKTHANGFYRTMTNSHHTQLPNLTQLYVNGAEQFTKENNLKLLSSMISSLNHLKTLKLTYESASNNSAVEYIEKVQAVARKIVSAILLDGLTNIQTSMKNNTIVALSDKETEKIMRLFTLVNSYIQHTNDTTMLSITKKTIAAIGKSEISAASNSRISSLFIKIKQNLQLMESVTDQYSKWENEGVDSNALRNFESSMISGDYSNETKLRKSPKERLDLRWHGYQHITKKLKTFLATRDNLTPEERSSIKHLINEIDYAMEELKTYLELHNNPPGTMTGREYYKIFEEKIPNEIISRLDKMESDRQLQGVLVPSSFTFNTHDGHTAPTSIAKNKKGKYFLFLHNSGAGKINSYNQKIGFVTANGWIPSFYQKGVTTIPFGPLSREEAVAFVSQALELSVRKNFTDLHDAIAGFENMYPKDKLMDMSYIPERRFQNIGNCQTRNVMEYVIFSLQKMNLTNLANDINQFDLALRDDVYIKDPISPLKPNPFEEIDLNKS